MGEIILSKYFGFNLIDYERQGDGLLIASGAGIMMAVMDAVPRFRYCIDIDAHRDINSRVPEWMVAIDQNTDLKVIGVAGWFSIDKPQALQEGIKRVKHKALIAYSGNYKVLENEQETLDGFIHRANSLP